MKIEVSNGEFLDKLSILEIKISKIQDAEKLKNIENEYAMLKPLGEKLIQTVKSHYDNLLKINNLLWNIEDKIRDLERDGDFGEAFIHTARQVYRFNDERAQVKKEINLITNSDIIEEKSYSG
jgi:hypothetical protein